MIKIDPYTGEEFFTHKGNQKFATRQNQIDYNNHMKLVDRDKKKLIDARLAANRRILQKLLGDNSEIIVSLDDLRAENFNFGTITHFSKKNNSTIFGIYEFTYKVLPDSTDIEIGHHG
jgi:hypothetical protein